MAAEFSTQHLPPLINGRRYSHELGDPKQIPVEIRRDVLELLHNYYAAVCLHNERTLSEASGTSAAARSEASAGTSITEMTFAFSADNGSVQREPTRKPLHEVQRARKALLRKLKACLEDCRKRKVKVTMTVFKNAGQWLTCSSVSYGITLSATFFGINIRRMTRRLSNGPSDMMPTRRLQ
jgi:hypothetical protein